MDAVKVIIAGLAAIFLVLATLFGVSLLLAYPIKWLWNEVCPDIFGLPIVGLWQAWCLSLLSSVFFKSPSYTKKES